MDANHELRMGQIRARVRRAGTEHLSTVAEERRYLLEEVDRLAVALAAVEVEVDRQVENQIAFLKGRVDILTNENRDLKHDLDIAIIERDAAEVEYESLSASVAALVNGSTDFAVADRMRLQAAMAHRVKQVEEACEARIADATAAREHAEANAAAWAESAEREKDIRRRVHERFKRVRRDAVQASYEIKRLRTELNNERDLGLNARKFAALAYRTLEAEKEEDAGAEPTWP